MDLDNTYVLPLDEHPSSGAMPVPTPEDQQGATAVGPPTVLAPAAAEADPDNSAGQVEANPMG
eukprot:12122891-Alexandrium_andersonii.AAC.1